MSAPMPLRLVIVGCSLAGLRAAQAARREGFEGSVVLVGREEHLPYDRPPLSKGFLVDDHAEATFFVGADDLAALDVDVRLGVSATGLDAAAKSVITGQKRTGYDKLIIATGGDARLLAPGQLWTSGSGDDRPLVEVLRTLDDARSLRDRVRPSARIVVVGAGFIGSEIASSARSLSASVVLVEAANVPLVRALGPVVGDAVSRLHERFGTELLAGVQVEGIAAVGDERRVTLSSGQVLDADVVVAGIGAVPATGWIGSALDLHPLMAVCSATSTCAPRIRTCMPAAMWSIGPTSSSAKRCASRTARRQRVWCPRALRTSEIHTRAYGGTGSP
ncbi:NAD(P)/FAD-dependent oxidoreductase [Saccharopolyspora shandongensis]|uniref:NAD(P)/FAD-dependent oxidoreductase n=1 Tax=Saccharopolyspora shandongensis TaxID=418495 RepID=UPI0033E8088F